MKLCKCIITILTLAIIFTGCTEEVTKEKNIYEEIYKRYSNIDSYSCNIKFTVKSNKTTNIFTAEQSFNKPDSYILKYTSPDSIKGLTISYNNDGVNIVYPGISEEYKSSNISTEEQSYLFINSFFDIYFSSEEVVIEVTNIDNNESNQQVVLEVDIPGRNRYRHKLKLNLDRKTALPIKMITYDVDYNETIIVEFSDFTFNMEAKNV